MLKINNEDLIFILLSVILQGLCMVYKIFYACNHEYRYKGKTRIITDRGESKVLHIRECRKCGKKDQSIEYY